MLVEPNDIDVSSFDDTGFQTNDAVVECGVGFDSGVKNNTSTVATEDEEIEKILIEPKDQVNDISNLNYCSTALDMNENPTREDPGIETFVSAKEDGVRSQNIATSDLKEAATKVILSPIDEKEDSAEAQGIFSFVSCLVPFNCIGTDFREEEDDEDRVSPQEDCRDEKSSDFSKEKDEEKRLHYHHMPLSNEECYEESIEVVAEIIFEEKEENRNIEEKGERSNSTELNEIDNAFDKEAPVISKDGTNACIQEKTFGKKKKFSMKKMLGKKKKKVAEL